MPIIVVKNTNQNRSVISVKPYYRYIQTITLYLDLAHDNIVY